MWSCKFTLLSELLSFSCTISQDINPVHTNYSGRWIKISSRKASPIPSGVTKEKRYLVSWRFEAFFREVSRTILQWRAESYSYISWGLGQIPPLALMASSIYISACWNPLYEVSPPLPHPLNLTLTSNYPCLANARFLPPSTSPWRLRGSSGVKLSHSRDRRKEIEKVASWKSRSSSSSMILCRCKTSWQI